MKFLAGLFFSVLFSFATHSFANNAETITAIGEVTYKLSTGPLAYRDVTLDIPARGQGSIVLKGAHTEMATEFFESATLADGRTVFVVAFANPPGAPEGTCLVFHGTYMRGSNKAIYFGDLYSIAHPADAKEVLEQFLHAKPEGEVTHKGGFYFSADVG